MKRFPVTVFIILVIMLAHNYSVHASELNSQEFMAYDDNVQTSAGAFMAYNDNVQTSAGAFMAYNDNVQTSAGAFTAYDDNGQAATVTSMENDISMESEFDILENIDDTEINELLGEIFSEDVSFKLMVRQLLNGELEFDSSTVAQMAKAVFLQEISENKKSLISVFLLCVMAALFTNFTKVLERGSVAQIGFYILFLLLIAILFRSFSITYGIASALLTQMTEFMKVLLPAFFITVIAAKGAATAVVFYEFILTTVYIVELLLLKFVMPLCGIYVVVNLINQISKEDLFSKMGELLRQIIIWIIKWLFAIVMGINAIHSIIAPAVDSFKNTVFHKTMSAIPGIGNTLGGVSDVVIGSGVLIKNGVGGAILILLVLLIITPLIKLVCCMIMYRITAALIQPVCDKRMINMVETVASGSYLLIKCVSTVAALFFLTMAVLTVAAG